MELWGITITWQLINKILMQKWILKLNSIAKSAILSVMLNLINQHYHAEVCQNLVSRSAITAGEKLSLHGTPNTTK